MAMPDAPLRLCSYPGCATRVRSGRCNAHQKAKYRQQDDLRGSAARRGYGSDWRETRAGKLAADPLCEQCLAEGFETLAAEVHHKVTIRQDPTKRLDYGNLMSLCKPCHSRITLRESVSPQA